MPRHLPRMFFVLVQLWAIPSIAQIRIPSDPAADNDGKTPAVNGSNPRATATGGKEMKVVLPAGRHSVQRDDPNVFLVDDEDHAPPIKLGSSRKPDALLAGCLKTDPQTITCGDGVYKRQPSVTDNLQSPKRHQNSDPSESEHKKITIPSAKE